MKVEVVRLLDGLRSEGDGLALALCLKFEDPCHRFARVWLGEAEPGCDYSPAAILLVVEPIDGAVLIRTGIDTVSASVRVVVWCWSSCRKRTVAAEY